MRIRLRSIRPYLHHHRPDSVEYFAHLHALGGSRLASPFQGGVLAIQVLTVLCHQLEAWD